MKKQRVRYIGQPFWFNCNLYALLMCLDSRIAKILIRWNKWYPHFLVETKNGNILHLTSNTNKTGEPNRDFILWFYGIRQCFYKSLLRPQKYYIFKIRKSND